MSDTRSVKAMVQLFQQPNATTTTANRKSVSAVPTQKAPTQEVRTPQVLPAASNNTSPAKKSNR